MNTEHKTEKTDDELIALWDGWKRHHSSSFITNWHGLFLGHPKFSGILHINDMEYKTSFDWIMPVFQRINSGAIDDYTCIHIDRYEVFIHLKGEDDCQQIPINGDLLGAIYTAVVIVLRWAENKK